MNRSARAKLLRRSRSLYTAEQVRVHLQDEHEAHRLALKNQRARVRGARLAPPKRTEGAATSAQTNDRAAALLEHIAEGT